jgi:hypothetical protein
LLRKTAMAVNGLFLDNPGDFLDKPAHHAGI